MSQKERKETKIDLGYKSLIYGELEFQSICEIFRMLQNKYGIYKKPGGVFYDLGSVSKLTNA